MGYSKATRRQLIMADLIEGAVDATRAANPSNVYIDQVLRRITELQATTRAKLALINRRGGVVFESAREHRRYRAELTTVQEAVHSQWPDEELDGREYVNALLTCVDELAQKPSRTQSDWLEMSGQLQRLYEEMDPGLEAESRMDVGEDAAEALRSAMEEV